MTSQAQHHLQVTVHDQRRQMTRYTADTICPYGDPLTPKSLNSINARLTLSAIRPLLSHKNTAKSHANMVKNGQETWSVARNRKFPVKSNLSPSAKIKSFCFLYFSIKLYEKEKPILLRIDDPKSLQRQGKRSATVHVHGETTTSGTDHQYFGTARYLDARFSAVETEPNIVVN